ncbi:MAG TPA: hypothetical protein VGR09_13165 [Gemmatimonadales bacterium]|nr:hypothetical protein [Gemmatimonadales bacterium]
MRYCPLLLVIGFLFACQEASPPTAPTSDPVAGAQAANTLLASGSIVIVSLGFTAALDVDEQGRTVGWKSASTGAQAVVWSPGTARAATGTRTVLSGLGGDTYAWGLNDGADITGGSTVGSALHAVVWSSSALHSIGEPAGAVGGFAEDITNALSDGTRLVAGRSDFPTASRPTVWRVSGTGSSLAVVGMDLLPGFGSNGSGQAIGVNSSGVVVGDAEAAGSDPQPARWTLSGTSWSITALGLLAGQTYGQVLGVSSTGDAVGFNRLAGGTACMHGAVWPANTVTPKPLHDLAGGLCSTAWSINAAGQITGSARDSRGRNQAVLWLPSGTGTYTVLALGNRRGAFQSEGRGLNSPQADGTGGTALEVVGQSGGAAVLWKVKLP